jgi:hypothetical protein
MAFITFILAVCIFILFNNFYKLKKESAFIKSIIEKYSNESFALKREIEELKKALEGKVISTENSVMNEALKGSEVEIAPDLIRETVIEDASLHFTPVAENGIDNELSVEEIEPIATPEIESPIVASESQTAPWIENQAATDLHHVQIEENVESAFSKFLKTAEKQFSENWTGILGTAIMVLGIGYLSIYTALKVAPLFRVFILWFYAGLLIGSYYFLQKKEKWTTTGLWLRSAGGSLFLFGCFGSSQIQALAFIANPIGSYALIGMGIGLNLYIGYIIKKQTFLSLHVILSMLILCVIPEKTFATFILAAITATIGIVLSYKEKWEYHLLIVISAFIVFDIWFTAQGTKLSLTENIFAILGIIAVAGSCLVMQYRSYYENTFFDKTAFITHLSNWILFASGLILHSTGSRFKTFVLFIGAILCFFIALKARKRKIHWLFHLDGMVAFVLLSLSTIMLNDWNVGFDVIACILYVLVLACLFVVYIEKETLMYKIFLGINHVLAVVLIVFLAIMISNSLANENITNALVTTIIITIVAISVPVYASVKKELEFVDAFYYSKNFSLNGLLAIVSSAFVILKSNDLLVLNLFVVVVFGIAIIWAALKQKFGTYTFDVGRIIFFTLSVLSGILIIKTQEKSYLDFVFAGGLVTVIFFNWRIKQFFKNDFIIRLIGIIGMNALLFLLVYKYLPNYQIIQIFSLFGIGLINHEFLWINLKKNSLTTDNQTMLCFFYYFFSVIGSVFFLSHNADFSTIEIALVCLGISAIELYVLFAKQIKNNSELATKQWANFNLMNSELLLFNIIVFGFSCFQIEYVSLIFALFAVISFVGFQKLEEFKRFNNYSFFLLIGSALMTIYVAFDNYNEKVKTLVYLCQASTVLLSISYSYLQYKMKNEKGTRFNVVLPYFQNLWIALLLYIQVDLCYLPIVFMILAIINFWLIKNNKINIQFHFVPVIAILAILFSIYYSFDKLNSFNVIDWILQISGVALGLLLVVQLNIKEKEESLKFNSQIVLNIWLSLIMFSQLPYKWLPVYWAATAIVNLYLYHRKISNEKNTSIVYYLLANLHLGFISFNFYESKFLAIYLLIFVLLSVYIYLAYKWMEEFELKNSLLVYPATLSIGCFLYLTFDKGILTFFWILEALGLLILGILLKEKYFRYVSLSLVGLCVVRLMFFDLSNADFLIRALVLLGVGIVLLIMNTLFKKYKDRFD